MAVKGEGCEGVVLLVLALAFAMAMALILPIGLSEGWDCSQ